MLATAFMGLVLRCILSNFMIVYAQLQRRRCRQALYMAFIHRRHSLFQQSHFNNLNRWLPRQCLRGRHSDRLRHPRHCRLWWVFPRSRDWWENFVLHTWDNGCWQKNFRMPRKTPFEIVDFLTPHIECKTTVLRNQYHLARELR